MSFGSFFERAKTMAKDLQTSAQSLDISSQFRQVAGGEKKKEEEGGARGEKQQLQPDASRVEASSQHHSSSSQQQGNQAAQGASSFFSRAKEGLQDFARDAAQTAQEVSSATWDFTSQVKNAQSLDTLAAKITGKKTAAKDASEARGEDEKVKYGVTEELVEFVKKELAPNSFLAKSKEWPKEDDSSWRLTPWQEKHVLLILAEAPSLRDCRYLLTPKKMSEQRFWEIYFALTFGKAGGGGSGGKTAAQSVGEETEEATDEETAAVGATTDDETVDADEADEDLEAYLESVLANKDLNSEASDSEIDDEEALEDYLNELEVASTSEELVKVEKLGDLKAEGDDV